jgi:hypothetical protein
VYSAYPAGYAPYTKRYLQAEKKAHRTVKHIYFLPTLKANAEKLKELALFQPTTIQ